jgi:hypothetical protein
MTTQINTNTTTADFSVLVAVIEQPMSSTAANADRVRWLLELAAALDTVSFEGAADLATQARADAARLISNRIAWVSGRQS